MEDGSSNDMGFKSHATALARTWRDSHTGEPIGVACQGSGTQGNPATSGTQVSVRLGRA